MKKILSVLVFTIYVSTITQLNAQTIPPYIPTNGLLAWYPFNGNVLDLSGNANHCEANSSATLSSDRFNNLNSAYSFDGSAYIGGILKIDTILNSYTISAWFKISQVQSFGGIVGPNPGQVGWSMFGLHSSTDNNTLYAEHNDGGLASNIKLETKFNVGAWQHASLVYNGVKVYLYLNGSLLDSQIVTKVLPQTSGLSLHIGDFRTGYPTVKTNPFKGQIDDIAIHKRALSHQEVLKVYESKANTTGIDEHHNNRLIKAYPNPVKDDFVICVETELIGSSFSVTDQLGKELRNGVINSTATQLELGNLDKGVYIIKINAPSVQFIKIVKN